MSEAEPPSPRPLVVHFGRMGDMIMLLPMIGALHARFGQPVDVLCSGRSTRELLEHQPGVGTLYWIRSRKDAYWRTPRQWRLARTLRARPPGPVWICEMRADEALGLLSRAGVPQSSLVEAASRPRAPGEHVVDHWLRFARLLPANHCAGANSCPATSLPIPQLIVGAEQRADLDRWLARRGLDGQSLILVQAGSRSTTRWGRAFRRPTNRKYWPAERWARVIDAIASIEPRARFLLTGVPNESRINARILRLARTNRAIDAARELPMRRLLALQERATGMISVDTGPAHSAAALACPVVVLFGIEDPRVYAPRAAEGEIVQLTGTVDGAPSMLGIEAEQVVDAWRQLRRRASDAPASIFSSPAMYGRSTGGTATEPSSF